MIHQEKVKAMAQMALYDKKKSKKDLIIHSYEEDDYMSLEVTKTFLSVAFGFLIIIGFIVLANMDTIISHFDTYNYKQIGLIAGIAFLILAAGYVWLTINRSRETYHQVKPRIRRYFRNLNKLNEIYEEETRIQEEFEKGEWKDGQ